MSAAIRLKQLAAEKEQDINVCVVEKGAEVGAHILSGNVFQPTYLNELIPDWKEKEAPVETKVTDDSLFFLTEKAAFPLPTPPSLGNHGNYIISLGQLCKWLGEQAEELGVEIYPGFSCSEVLYGDDNEVVGVATADMGIGKDGEPTENFARGMELRAHQTFFAEGARGSCSEAIMEKFNLRENCDDQTYAIGIKEVWEIDDSKHKAGSVTHTIGWPLSTDVYGGSFMYHMEPNQVLLGYAVGLDYANPYLSPYQEFQRFKHHPKIAEVLEGGTCVEYGARVINEGGLQSLPKLTFPGGALIGCSAGFVNVPKIKGSHNAMKTGMLAAESLFEHYSEEEPEKMAGVELSNYQTAFEASPVHKELHEVRNVRPAFKFGMIPWMIYSGLETFLLKGRTPWTFSFDGKDCDHTKPAKDCEKIEYPKADGKLSFELLNNLQRSGVYHEDDQPAHLKVKDDKKNVPIEVSYEKYASPETRFCPAKVYEVLTDDDGKNPRLQINAQNCIHCKTCSIKTPEEYINWTVPEGAGGPNYGGM